MQVKITSLLSTNRFLPLFATQFFGAFNNNAFKNALIMLITYKLASDTHYNTQVLITMTGGLFILPFFLFSATGGQIADKYEKTQLIVKIKIVELLLMLLSALGFYLNNLTILMTSLFFLGLLATSFGPLKYAIIPYHLKENELIAGNGLIEAGTFIAILLGNIVGGILILLPKGAFLIAGTNCVIALIGLISSLFIPKTPHKKNKLVIRSNFFKETMDIIRYTFNQQLLFKVILGISWFWLIGSIFLAELPTFCLHILNANEHVATYFIALFSIGIAVGSILCNILLSGQVNIRYVPYSALGMALFGLDFCFAAHQFSAINQSSSSLITPMQFILTLQGVHISIALLLISVFGGLYTVPLYTLLQHASEESHRARVIASNNIFNSLFMVLASLYTMTMFHYQYTVMQVFLVILVITGLLASIVVFLSYRSR